MLKYKKQEEQDCPKEKEISISEVYQLLDEDYNNYKYISKDYQMQYQIVMYAANSSIPQLQNKLKNPDASIRMFLYIIAQYSPYKLTLKKETGSFSIVDVTNSNNKLKMIMYKKKIKVKTLTRKKVNKKVA